MIVILKQNPDPSQLDSLIHWFPVISSAIYTWFLDTNKESVLKASIIGAQVLWLVYDLFYLNYTAALFDAFTILSNFIGILMVRKAAK